MGVFVVPHTVKDILAKATKEGVSSLCIPLLVVNLITNKVGRILRFWEACVAALSTPKPKASNMPPCEFSTKKNHLPQRWEGVHPHGTSCSRRLSLI
jgi:hypothetical protein